MDEEKGLRIVSKTENKEETAAGYHVTVEKPKDIYLLINDAAALATHNILIQDDLIGDTMCSKLSTKLSAYDHQSTFNPGSYDFTAEMDFRGRKPSELSFSKGYLAKKQLEELKYILNGKGYEKLNFFDADGFNTLQFSTSEGNLYYMTCGFNDEETHRQWIKQQIEKEELEGRTGFYSSHQELLAGKLDNDNFILRSQVFHYPETLDLEGVFAFTKTIEQFANVYEDFVNVIYTVNSLKVPDKTIVLKSQKYGKIGS